MTGTHRDTIRRLLVEIGEGCAQLMDEQMRDLPCRRIEVDEIWSYQRSSHRGDSRPANSWRGSSRRPGRALAKGASLRTDDAQQRATKAMIRAAIVLYLYVTDTLCGDGTKPSQDHCVIFHSYRGERVAALSNYRRVLRNMEAVCRGVSRGWDKIEPPPNFDERQARYRSN